MSHEVSRPTVERLISLAVFLGKAGSKMTWWTDLDDKTVDFLDKNQVFVIDFIMKVVELFGHKELSPADVDVIFNLVSQAQPPVA